MSVIAATLTSHAEVCHQVLYFMLLAIKEFQVVGDCGLSGLDDLTSLLSENDSRLIVDLLKLAVADRIESEQAKEVSTTRDNI